MLQPLYHYCSAIAFESIIKNHSIWLNSLRSSNDATEGRYAARLLKELISEIEIPLRVNRDKLFTFLNTLEDQFEIAGFCLSEKADLLSQWRGYADDGHGFSIGFRRNSLIDIANKFNNSDKETTPHPVYKNAHKILEVNLFKVLYEKESQLKNLKPVSEKIFRTDETSWFDNHVDFVLKQSAFKDNSFQEEEEWRLIKFISVKSDPFYSEKQEILKNVKYRIKGNILYPYVNIPFYNDPKIIEEVIIGPKNQFEEAHLRNFLISQGYKEFIVKKSRIPYR